MKEPYEIVKGWYFEGNMSLLEKQTIIKRLPSLGLLKCLRKCAQDFVAGKSVRKYGPEPEEARRLIQSWKDVDTAS